MHEFAFAVLNSQQAHELISCAATDTNCANMCLGQLRTVLLVVSLHITTWPPSSTASGVDQPKDLVVAAAKHRVPHVAELSAALRVKTDWPAAHTAHPWSLHVAVAERNEVR